MNENQYKNNINENTQKLKSIKILKIINISENHEICKTTKNSENQ